MLKAATHIKTLNRSIMQKTIRINFIEWENRVFCYDEVCKLFSSSTYKNNMELFETKYDIQFQYHYTSQQCMVTVHM